MSKPKTYDFSGWATKNDIRCTDGRTIRKDAFKDDNGRKVPLVWMHDHKDPSNVLGHAYLENVDEGVIAYGVFNDTFAGKQVRELVKHGDVWSLSIWANNLTQNGGDVMHGSIKEVSVVLAPANPGAVIVDFPILAHGEEATDQVVIQIGEWLELGPNLQHAEEERDEPKDDPEQKPAEDAKEEPEKKPEEASPEEAEPDGSNEGETLNHGDEETVQDILDSMDEKQRNVCNYLVDLARNGENPEDQLEHASDEKDDGSEEDDDGETIGDIIETMNEKQKNVCKFLINEAFKAKEAEEGEEEPEKKAVEDEKSDEVKHSDEEREEEKTMNVFEQYGKNAPKNENALSHSADGNAIIKMAKENGGMSLRAAIGMYAKNNNKEIMHADESLQHANDDLGFQDIDQLFPDYQLTNGPEPEALTHDTSWVAQVMRKVSKSPKSRLRVRFADKRDITGRRAQGYTKGQQKQFMGNIKLLGRTVDPTTVYNLDHLNRDDEVDITDFNIVNYMYRDQRANLEEELARAILIGDGRNGSPEDDGEEIDKTKIIPIWEDDELFAIHKVVDVQGMRETMNGSDSSKNFGDNYVYSEAIIQSMLYAREDYKGSGGLDFWCAPHLVNVMLLARDLNGRRIYDNVNELKAAMNVNDIITVEQFAGKTRKVVVNGREETRALLGIMVNLKDYKVGSTSGGEITHFTDFDLRFNQHLSLLETRLSGMLERPFSAIVLEEVVNPQ